MESEFRPEEMKKIVRELSFPRLPGSEGDPKAVEYCKSLFSEINIPLNEEEFITTKFWVGFLLQFIAIIGIGFVTIMTYLFLKIPWANIIPIVIVLVMIAIFGPKFSGTGDLKLIGKSIPTKNLWQRIPSSDEKKGYFIISGHHDSKSQPLNSQTRAFCFIFGGFALLIMILFYLTGIILDFLEISIPEFVRILGIVFAVSVIIAGIPLVFNGVGNISPGALDNASSIAVLYELGRSIKYNPFKHYETIILITGSEELGMVGARAFVNQHIDDFPPNITYNINFDTIGYKEGPVQVIEYIGFPFKKPISMFLNGLGADVAKKKGIELKGFWMPTGAATDSNVFASRGYERMDFCVSAASKLTHRKDDTHDKFDGNIAVKNCEIAMGIMKKIDKNYT